MLLELWMAFAKKTRRGIPVHWRGSLTWYSFVHKTECLVTRQAHVRERILMILCVC
jgi:hypothetical protein